MGDAHQILLNNRPIVQDFGDVVAGRADQLHTAYKGLVIGLGSYKRRQKRVMDINDAPRILSQKFMWQNLHVARQHDKVRLMLSQ